MNKSRWCNINYRIVSLLLDLEGRTRWIRWVLTIYHLPWVMTKYSDSWKMINGAQPLTFNKGRNAAESNFTSDFLELINTAYHLYIITK